MILLNNKKYLNRLFESDKPLIIYKAKNGYEIYTDFSDKIKMLNLKIKNISLKISFLPQLLAIIVQIIE